MLHGAGREVRGSSREATIAGRAFDSETSGTRGILDPGAITEVVVAAIGLALCIGAAAANQHWLDRHFLPSFFLTRDEHVFIETLIRVVIAAFGVMLALVVRPRAGRFVARTPAAALHVLIAAALALGASELVLRRVHLRPAEWLFPADEPRRRPDPLLGWTLVPARTGHDTLGGRVLEYVLDPAGYRVRRAEEPVDPRRQTILFTGESVMFGEGLTWDETVPAQVGGMMRMQIANLSVSGFSSDQAYLRLRTELPRFTHPVAVVSFFMTTVFGRNLDDDRPHLTPGLVWLPASTHWRLTSLAKVFVPYRSSTAVERGIQVTREVFRASHDLARARGAASLIVVPHFGREEPTEQMLRRRILDEARLPYVLVDMDPAWRVPRDGHPDARGARAIAEAIAARLRQYVRES